MLKVLIADDEMLVRVGIKSTVEWEKYGCTVVAEAVNGEDALRKIETYAPDILLTDIRMPKMDGLELLRQIEEKEIEIETVIMSCYNEFELVKEAMKLGASDYLLKLSFTEEELINVIRRISKKIEKRKSPDSGNLFNQSDLRIKLFQKLTNPSVTQEQKQQMSDNLGLCVDFEDAGLMLLMADHVYDGSRMGYCEPDEQSKNIMLNFLEEYLRGKGYGEVFCVDDTREVFAVFLNRNLALGEVAQAVRKRSEEYLKVSLSVYLFPDGMYEHCPNYIPFGIEELSDKRYFEGSGQICSYQFSPEYDKERLKNDNVSKHWEGTLLKGIRQTEELEEKIQTLAARMKRSRIPRKECRRIFTECAYNAASSFHRAGGTMKGLEESSGCDMMKNLQSLESIEDAISWFRDFKKAADIYIKDCVSRQKRSEIEEAMYFIHENYSLSLSLADVAEKAGLSTAYFSTVFKKENGDSFVEYLTELRVERAKELLRDRQVCIYEVGEKVGYPDPNYFSKIFRKVTGLSPEKYRKQGLNETD